LHLLIAIVSVTCFTQTSALQQRQYFRFATAAQHWVGVKNHQHPRSLQDAKTAAQIFCSSTGDSGTNTQQHLKSALCAKIFSSLLAAMLAAVKTPL
jgi:cation transport regulator ChaC